ncbi:hypothetical protein D3C86_1751310 [compost metagenome]
MVHRRVGVLHQLAEFVAVLRAQGDADTGRDKELAAFEHERFYQAGENLFSDVDRPVQGDFTIGSRLQEQGEFVAAHPRHGVVIVDATEQARGHFLEHAVAGGVAQGVVDRLEAIEVEEHQHHPRLLPFGRLQCRVQAILEQ